MGPLTVEVALGETPLREARVAAGAAGLDRRIEAVGVFERDELDTLRPDQLVLSSAHALTELDLRRLVERFARARVSAFGVEPGRLWPRLPDELVEACETRGLPLLVLPHGRFEAFVNQMLEAIAERQRESLRRMGELHGALTRAALDDEAMPAIAATVARALGVPVAVFDGHGTLVTAAGGRVGWTRPGLAERAAAVAGPGVVAIDVDATPYLVAPISTVGRRYGVLCAAGPVADEAFARATLVQGAVVCGLKLVGRERVEAVHRRFERQLLEELADRCLSPEDSRERAERLGWPSGAPYVVLLASRRGDASGGTLNAARYALDDDSAAAVSRALAGAPVRTFPRRHGLAIIVHLDADERTALERIRRRLPAAAADLVIGVSAARVEVTDLPDALREATLALMTSTRTAEAGLQRFSDLGPARLMGRIADTERLAAMAFEALGPLADPNGSGGRELVSTLAALLEHNMRLADAASDLYFHYNTVRHRLARLRTLLGPRIAEPDDRLSLSLALAALRIVAVERPDLVLRRIAPGVNGGPSSARTRSRSAPARNRSAH
jgi:PucR family transcriptional regulator, purine catabolism regulatory protein